uniref:Uncharacterized protein n=1 Tax=Romanomermis culicivorax TaxID=13658 RepID=A0A915JFE7_ROMCU
MVDEPTMSQQVEMASKQQQLRLIARKQQTPPEKRYPSVPTAPVTAQILPPSTTDEMIVIDSFNPAHLNFDPTILQQATAASQQIAQDCGFATDSAGFP